MDCHALLQGIFLTQRLNLCLFVSCTNRQFFTTSATWEAHLYLSQVVAQTVKNLPAMPETQV